MDRLKIFELALETLQRQKAEIDEEIEALQNELNGTGPVVSQIRSSSPSRIGRRRRRTAAERRAHSLRMKEIWAARRAQAAKRVTTAERPAPTKAKVKTATQQKKAISVAMKKAWAKRKAEEAKAKD